MVTRVLVCFFVATRIANYGHMSCFGAHHFANSRFFAFIAILVQVHDGGTLAWPAPALADRVSRR